MLRRSESLLSYSKSKEDVEIPAGLISQLALMMGRHKGQNISIYNGFLKPEEVTEIQDKIQKLSNLVLKENRKRGYLKDLLEQLGLPRQLQERLIENFQLDLITRNDIDFIKDLLISFENDSSLLVKAKLSLPIRIFIKTLIDLEDKDREAIFNFLRNRGIIQINSVLRPTPEYIEAIESQSGVSLQEKISQVLKNRNNNRGRDQLEESSHRFITINFIKTEGVGLTEEEITLLDRLSEKTNPYEERYARIILTRAILSENMNEVRIALLSMGGMAGVFHIINSIVENRASEEFYFIFQGLVKSFTHVVANLIDFYSQFKLFLKGDNLYEEFKDLINRIGVKGYLVILNGIIMDFVSELLGKDFGHFLGSLVFGLEPSIGTSLTSFLGLQEIENETKNEEKISIIDRIKTLLENPAVLSMNFAAFLTFLTSVGILGIADQFHNPFWVVFIGGFSEPFYAALISKILEKIYNIKQTKAIFKET